MSKEKAKNSNGKSEKKAPEGSVTIKVGGWEHRAVDPATVSVDGVPLCELLQDHRRAEQRTGVLR
jgi:hypothetical protein